MSLRTWFRDWLNAPTAVERASQEFFLSALRRNWLAADASVAPKEPADSMARVRSVVEAHGGVFKEGDLLPPTALSASGPTVIRLSTPAELEAELTASSLRSERVVLSHASRKKSVDSTRPLSAEVARRRDSQSLGWGSTSRSWLAKFREWFRRDPRDRGGC